MLIKEYEYCINYQYIIQCFTEISLPLEKNKRSDKIPQVRKIQGMWILRWPGKLEGTSNQRQSNAIKRWCYDTKSTRRMIFIAESPSIDIKSVTVLLQIMKLFSCFPFLRQSLDCASQYIMSCYAAFVVRRYLMEHLRGKKKKCFYYISFNFFLLKTATLKSIRFTVPLSQCWHLHLNEHFLVGTFNN